MPSNSQTVREESKLHWTQRLFCRGAVTEFGEDIAESCAAAAEYCCFHIV
jgi:hypothetical protein